MKANDTAREPTSRAFPPPRGRGQAAAKAGGDGAGNGWVSVGRASELRGRGPFGVSVVGQDLVLVRTADGLRSFEGRCPHQGALLAEGELSGDELVCRNHRWRFDAESGMRRGGPGCLRACPLEVRGDELFARPDVLAAPAASAGALRTVGRLPGPRALPLVGSTLGVDLGRLHTVLERWTERYGPVYRMHLGPRRFLVASDPVLIQRTLRERPETYRRIGTVEPVFRELGIDGVFSAEGVEWRPLRKLTMEALTPDHLRSFYPTLRTVAERLHRRWSAAADDGRVVDLQEDFKRFTVDLTTRLAFGHDLNTLEQEGDVLQRKLEHVFPGLMRRLLAAVPLWRVVKLPSERRLEASVSQVLSFLRGLLVGARARLEADPGAASRPATFLDAMLAARDEAGRPFSDGQILGNAIQFLLAGEDTTALTLSWAAHELCDAPEAVSALRAEADEILAGSATPPDFEAAGRLQVAAAVANETMRLRPVAPLLFLETNREAVLGDVSLERGQGLILLMRPPACSDASFSDPRAFRPERWLRRPPGAAHEPSAHMPFGSGPRLCPGRALALLEMRVALATLFRSFSIQRVGDRAEVEERFAFTMSPQRLQVRMRRRGSA
jgi:cytochrome P450/nitrite reductase/ring-hydroxylating ferredoxin subunit